MAALTIEDGTIVTDADSYVTAAELVTFAAEYGHTIGAVEADNEILLRNAMHAMEGRNWKGDRVSSTQSLPWPRTAVYVDGQLLDYTSIPRQLRYGQLNLAVEAYSTDLLPISEANAKGAISVERVEGAVTREYYNTGKVMPIPASAKADTLLRQLEHHSGLNVVRA